MKTTLIKQDQIKRNWYLVDANSKVLGRLASKIAYILKGKNKVHQAPHMDTGDYIIVINAEKIAVTGNKEEDKKYYRHSQYRGNLKTTNVREMREKDPTKILYNAIYGMLPDNRLRANMLDRLKIFVGSSHTHEAQTPQKLEI